MKYFDLHCDTLSEIFNKGESLRENTCHVSLNKASVFEKYTQVLAVWSDNSLSDDENYEKFLKILDHAETQIRNIDFFIPILAVEGGKLLNNDISRLDVLKNRGIRIFTLVWKGNTCMGGAYDNNEGLSSFGKAVTERLLEYSIVPDLSHSNDIICAQALEMARYYGKPVIASHSCARSICSHPRNISDEIARSVAESGGLVGVNMVSEHLGGRSTEAVLAHIERLLDKAGKESVCFGCDFDGMSDAYLPEGIKNVGDMPILYDKIAKKYHSEALADKIFYSNAQNFANVYLF